MNNIDLIDRYFGNSLSPKEQLLFNDLLQNNEDFKNEFVFQKDLKKVIALNQRENLKSTLQQFEDNAIKNTKILFLSKKWLIAASLALLIGLGFWFVKNTYFISSEKLFTQNFEPYRNIIQPIVRGESSNTIEYRAFLAYENNDYHKAINLFNSVNNQDATYVSFYKAMCYLSLDKTTEAINLLEPIILSSNLVEMDKQLSEKADWYLALAYLKTGENKKAVSKFLIVIDRPCNACKKKRRSENILKHLN